MPGIYLIQRGRLYRTAISMVNRNCRYSLTIMDNQNLLVTQHAVERVKRMTNGIAIKQEWQSIGFKKLPQC